MLQVVGVVSKLLKYFYISYERAILNPMADT